jgi:putative PIN family toxin of toxin-antitoxin system
MVVVLDTNIIVAPLSSFSKYHWVIKKLRDMEYSICYTSEILLEYEEIITKKYGEIIAENFLSFLKEFQNGRMINISYRWNLISDPDDNKFADCAIAGQADYIISEDRHFKALASVDFPKVVVIGIQEFEKVLNQATDRQGNKPMPYS